MTNAPTTANCVECKQPAQVVKAKPIWSNGLDEPSRWILDVDCGTCGVQSGWLPR